MAPVELEEQQEKLRRAVEEWRSRSQDLLKNLQKEPCELSFVNDQFAGDSFDPVRVIATPLDHSNLSALFESENVAVAKFVTVISYDCFEISKLSRYARKNIYRQLFLFGCGSSSQETLLEGEPQKAFGHSLSLFMELSELTSRMNAVTCNLFRQLDSIYSLQDKSGTPCNSFKNITVTSGFNSLADGLAMFLILDEILVQNGRIKNYLSLFARMWNKIKVEAENFGVIIGELDYLDQVVNHLEKLLDAGLFQRILGDHPWVDSLQKVRRNRKFLDACNSFIHIGLSEILQRLDTWKESFFDRKKILHYVALFLFSAYASGEVPERRLGKVIMEILQVVPVIYSENCLRFMLFDVMKRHFPESLSSWPTLRDVAREYDTMKKNYLIHLNEIYSRDWQAVNCALGSWIASFHSITPQTVEAFLRFSFKQIIQGILIARRMQLMTIALLDLHALLQVPIKRERLKSICHMIVLIKVIKNMFRNKELNIIQSLPHAINLIQADIENLLMLAKDKVELDTAKGSQASKMRILSSLIRGGKDADSSQSDSLSLVLIALRMLQGGGGNMRLLCLSIALDVLQSIDHLDLDYSKIKKLISKVDIVADFQSITEEVTDCCFLYWRKELIRTWLSMIYMDRNKFSWLQYLLDACGDGLQLLKLGQVGKYTLHLYEEEIEDALKSEIIAPLCRDIETDLRLHVHSIYLKGSVHVNPRKTGVSNLSWYLELKPLRLPFKCIDMKSHVRSYLNSAFYNHSAMSSYDWKIYSDMKDLAELKYGLVLDDAHLPEHCLVSGLEVTEIVENLQKFTTSYSYNMINQVFIERILSSPGQKALRVLGVGHVVSFITAHGLGIISSALDSTMAFLTQKVANLSHFLKDNAVSFHSFLELNFWKINEGTTNFRLIQVEDNNLVMRRLPFGDNELWFLEHLFYLIVEMGNAIGLLRILQAASSRHVDNISRFMYSNSSVKTFAEMYQKLGFMDEIVSAGKIMDLVVEKKDQANEQMESLSSLLATFSKEIMSSENIPFRGFFLIIPALIINMVESKINSKDNALRRVCNLDYQMIRDDGFIMGVAFILKVMGQEKSFDGLHWYSVVIKLLDEALLSLGETRDKEQQKGIAGLAGLKLWGQTSAPISTNAQKGIEKLKGYQKELELIHSGLYVARTLMS